MSNVYCPYCDEPQEICHDDGHGFDEDRLHEESCGDCGKSFVFSTTIHFSYEASEADCLNGAPHNYRPTFTFPIEATKMECYHCEHSRPCTDAEMADVVKERASPTERRVAS